MKIDKETLQEAINARCYRIIRYFKVSGRRRTIRNNVTLSEAQAHCSRKDTSRAGVWFDGYDYMKGCKPKEDEWQERREAFTNEGEDRPDEPA